MAPNEEPRATSAPPEDRHEAEATTRVRTSPPVPAAAEPAGPGFGTLGLAGLIALACGIGGAYVYERFLAEHPAAAPAPAPVVQTKGSVDPSDLADKVAALSQDVAALRKQAGAQLKPAVAPEIASLQVRVADLTESTDQFAPVPSKVDHLNNRVNELASTLTDIRNALVALQARQGGTTRLASASNPSSNSNSNTNPNPNPDATPGPSPIPASEPAPSPAPAPEATKDAGSSKLADSRALSRAADLFRHGRYKASLEAFDALELKDPDDARVWYYAALAHGFSTTDWDDGAARLVEKGIAREEAGTPSTRVIDAEFRDLTSANGKDWLAAYRKRVKAR